jgi:anti-sigma B factor antagonist
MTSPPQMSLVFTDGIANICVQGEVDLANAAELQALGEDAVSDSGGAGGSDRSGGGVRIDLSEVTFIDSTGLAALLAIRHRAGETGRKIILDRPSPRVRKILDITGLAGAFAIE